MIGLEDPSEKIGSLRVCGSRDERMKGSVVRGSVIAGWGRDDTRTASAVENKSQRSKEDAYYKSGECSANGESGGRLW